MFNKQKLYGIFQIPRFRQFAIFKYLNPVSLKAKPHMRPMTRLILAVCIVIISDNDAAFSQTCTDCRYISPVFDSVKITTVKFGQGPRFNGNMQELYMDIYEPYGDTLSNRPVAVFAFGGAFITGSRDDWYVILACEEIAKSGYVVASIDYRIYDDLTGMIAEIFLLQHQRIFFRPMQDMRAAVQYLKADFAELGNNYRIDTSKILIGGASSGAMTSLMTAYCDKESEMAQMMAGSVAALDDLGGFYSTSGLYPNYSWNAIATFNVAGSLVKANWIEPGDVPIILAHGDADQVVPYKDGSFGVDSFFDMQGSYVIDSVARAKGVCSYLYTMEGQDHPNEGIGIEYLKSVVYRMMLRMHAVIHGRSFCCELGLKVNPVDTVYYEPGGDPVCLAACAVNNSGSAQVKWCGMNCLSGENTSSVITIEPDTNLKYVSCMAYEGQCEAVSLNMIKMGTPVACDTPSECKSSSAIILNEMETSVQIYPQPVSGAFTLVAEFAEQLNELVTVEILDITGRKVFSKEFFTGKRLNEPLDVHKLSAGNYLLSISTPEIKRHQKLLIINN